MSGWIKLEKDLSNDPRVLKMASRLRHDDVTLGLRSRLIVVGALVTLWWYADTHIGDDDTLPIGADQVDELVGIVGFCNLMPSEWLEILDSDRVKLVDYTEHNGTTAKKRALSQRRMERLRKRNASVTPVSRTHDANTVTRPRPREDLEKIKEQERAVPALVLHESLPSEEWEQWIAHRRKRKWPCDSVTLGKQLRFLGQHDRATQRRIIDNSIQAGWQGLFPERGRKPSSVNPLSDWKPPPDTAEVG